jgi:hypothetical protein
MRSNVASAVGLVVGLIGLVGSAAAAAPADGWVVWQSTREEGRPEVYRARADGSQVVRLTTAGGFRPLGAPDGRWVSYGDSAGVVHVVRPDGSGPQTLVMGWPVTWLHDNGGLLIAEGADFYVHDPETKQKQLLFSHSDFPAFVGTTFQPNSVTQDSRYMLLGSHLYMNGYTGSNGSFTSGFSAVMVDLLARDKVYFIGNGCWPFTPPQGNQVFHICGEGGEGCRSYPDIMRLDLADLATRGSYQPEVSHPDPDWGHEYNPRVSTDNQWMVYMTSTGCHEGFDCDYEIFLHRLGAGAEAADARHRVTMNPAFDGYPDMYVGPLWQPATGARLLLTPNRHTMYTIAGALAGGLSGVRQVKVKHGGAGAPGSTLTAQTEVTSGQDWLRVTATADGFEVGLREGAALTRGRHQGVVTVTAAGLAPVSFPVTLMADDSFPAPPDLPPEVSDGGVPGDGPVSDGAASDVPMGTPPADDGCGCDLGDRGGAPAGTTAAIVLLALALARAAGRRQRRR